MGVKEEVHEQRFDRLWLRADAGLASPDPARTHRVRPYQTIPGHAFRLKRPPPRVGKSYSAATDTFRNLVLGVLLAIMIGWVLSIGRGVILPVVASLIVAYIVLGLAELVGRLPGIGPRIPVPARHVAAVLVIGVALFALLSLILSNIGQVVALAPDYQRRLLATIQTVAVRLGVETEPTWETLRRDVLGQINIQQVIGTTVARCRRSWRPSPSC